MKFGRCNILLESKLYETIYAVCLFVLLCSKLFFFATRNKNSRRIFEVSGQYAEGRKLPGSFDRYRPADQSGAHAKIYYQI